MAKPLCIGNEANYLQSTGWFKRVWFTPTRRQAQHAPTQPGWLHFSRSSVTAAPRPDGGVWRGLEGLGRVQKGSEGFGVLLVLISICSSWQPQPREGRSRGEQVEEMLPEVIALNPFQLLDGDFSHPPFAPAFCPVAPMAASVWVWDVTPGITSSPVVGWEAAGRRVLGSFPGRESVCWVSHGTRQYLKVCVIISKGASHWLMSSASRPWPHMSTGTYKWM